MNPIHQRGLNLRANSARASRSRPLCRFLTQGQLSLNIGVMITRSNLPKEQTTPNSLHTVLAFIMPVLLNFLELKYQGKDISPFDTHPITIWMSIACLLSYWLAYGVELTCFMNHLSPTNVQALRRIMVLFGSLSVGSLASILFPRSFQLSFFLLYTLVTLWGLYFTQLKMPCKWFQQRIMAKLFGRSHPQERQIRRSSTGAHWFVQSTSISSGNILPL